ncbi:hypothetical protein MalM25_14640 [Planctomycetes bacterium MalM25]|nr:hypothetical protein MalM25_14640 [Planctomycetes bacterium MalM25]
MPRSPDESDCKVAATKFLNNQSEQSVRRDVLFLDGAHHFPLVFSVVNQSINGTNSNFAPSNKPLSLSLSAGMTKRAMKLSVM